MSSKKSKPVIIIDTREKIPFDFDGDEAFEAVIHEKLDAGDYSIKGLEHVICIERKRTADELYLNFGKDKKRLAAEFVRLKHVKHKIIVVEETCEAIFNPMKYYINKKGINKGSPKMPVAVVVGALTDLMLEEHVHVVFAGDKAKSMIRGLLLRAWELHKDESFGN